MKKAAFYARVSSDLQKKEKTIESQIVELKKQIAVVEDVLVKEYIDDGYSGARLDRPAMDELRKDLKTNLFDVIYFLNTDRIAREVTYQTIIIAEILKYKKQIIINGKDYVHNPENKFTVTVLGAVAELERAKIIERTVRARQLRLAQGKLLGCGNNIFGYDYHKRTPTSDPYYTINEEQAEVVRQVFKIYTTEQIGVCQITRRLELQGAKTKSGKGMWRASLLKCMLRNETYIGIRNFNTMRTVREYANPMHGIETTTKKNIRRDRSDWIGIPVPAIITKETFQKVQERIAWNRKHYRNPRKLQLFSSLIRCGECNASFFAYHRFYKDKRMDPPKIFHKNAYKCSWRLRQNMHHTQTAFKRCHNKEIKSEILEEHVFEAIETIMLKPAKLKQCMDFLQNDTQTKQKKFERQLRYFDEKLGKLSSKKRKLVEIYASDEMEKEQYILKNLEYDNEINSLKMQRGEIASQIPLLYKTEMVNLSVGQYCENARVQYDESKDFETKRKFLVDHVSKVIFSDNNYEIHGKVPIKTRDESNSIAFKITGTIPRASNR